MEADQQRIAIAEFCGWRRCHAIEAKEDGITIRDKRYGGFKRKLLKWDHSQAFSGWYPQEGFHTVDIDGLAVSTEELLRDYDFPDYWKQDGLLPTRHLPHYESDLNAINEAEKMLSDEQYCTQSLDHDHDTSFTNHLRRILDNDTPADRPVRYGHASAAQRAKAFLQTIGRWEEES